MKTINRIAALSAAAVIALTSCSTTSVMGLSKASYVDKELEELDARTEGLDRLEERIDELDALSERMDGLDDEVADLNQSLDEARENDEELRDLADEFKDRLDGLSRETLLELVEALMEHLEMKEES